MMVEIIICIAGIALIAASALIALAINGEDESEEWFTDDGK